MAKGTIKTIILKEKQQQWKAKTFIIRKWLNMLIEVMHVWRVKIHGFVDVIGVYT
jgi:hypothetical protein